MNSRTMVDSGVEWIGRIPTGWSVQKVKNIALVSKGTQYDFDPSENPGQIPYINGGVKASWYSSKSNRDANLIAISEGGASAGYVQKVNSSWWCGAHCYSVNAFLKNDPNFIFWNLKAGEIVLQDEKTGTAMPNLQSGKLLNLVLAIPALSEQQSIASFLDHHVNLIDREAVLIDKKIKLLGEKRKSLIFESVTGKLTVVQRSSLTDLHNVVGHGDLVAVPTENNKMMDSGVEWIGDVPRDWEIKKIKNVAKVNPKTILPLRGKISFIPMERLLFGSLNLDEHIKLPAQSSYTKISNGDLLIAKVTPCFENGKIAVASNLTNGYGLGSSEITPFRTTNIETQYLKWFMQSPQFISAGVATMNGTVGLQRVSTQFWTNCHVTVPPKTSQEIISNFLNYETDLINKEISLLKRKQDLLIEKRKALIFEAVTGKIDCRSWTL